MGGQFILLEGDGSALVETSDDSPSEGDIALEVGVEAEEADIRGLNPDFSRHTLKDPGFEVGRVEIRIRGEADAIAGGRGGYEIVCRLEGLPGRVGNGDLRKLCDVAGHCGLVAVEECGGQEPEQGIDAGLVGLFAFEAMFLQRRMRREVVQAGDLRLAGLWAEWLAVDEDHQGYVALAGLNDLLCEIDALVLLMEDEAHGTPEGVGCKAIGDGLANDCVGIGNG